MKLSLPRMIRAPITLKTFGEQTYYWLNQPDELKWPEPELPPIHPFTNTQGGPVKIGLWSYSHKAITTEDYGYGRPAQQECGADFAFTGLDAARAAPLLIGTAQKVGLIVNPWDPARTITEWHAAGLLDRVELVLGCDEPELGGFSPEFISGVVWKTKAALTQAGRNIPVAINTFVSQRVYRAAASLNGLDATEGWQKLVQMHDELRDAVTYGGFQGRSLTPNVQWDALDYVNCGHDVHLFDYYPMMGTQDCSWMSQWGDIAPQCAAFREHFKGDLGYFGQAFHFRRCGVPDVTLDTFRKGFAICVAQWGERMKYYMHYAHVPSNAEGTFPQDDPKLRADMRAFHTEVNNVSTPVITPAVLSLTPTGQDAKKPSTAALNGRTCVEVIRADESLIDNIPPEAVNTGWWTVNAKGIEGKTPIVYVFDNGARVLQNVVVAKLVVPPVKFTVDVPAGTETFEIHVRMVK